MPELPEVEVTRRGIDPHLRGQLVIDVVVRRRDLRWPVPAGLEREIRGRRVLGTSRRGKYLLIEFDHGTLIVHLGMSGHLTVLDRHAKPRKHDHVDLVLANRLLRLHDPRRFGAVLWHSRESGHVHGHALLAGLGVEPFDPMFDGDLLRARTRDRSAAIKTVLLAGDVVVGVGNIYASESLFLAAINPKRPANRISAARYRLLADAIRATLSAAIDKGGSTLRDFVGADGASGYFQLDYAVYDRAGQPCRTCGTPIRQIRQSQRSTYYCPRCQRR
jgi:formamidopyrimidine-DNA glycosylase